MCCLQAVPLLLLLLGQQAAPAPPLAVLTKAVVALLLPLELRQVLIPQLPPLVLLVLAQLVQRVAPPPWIAADAAAPE